jgi:hypothetical protein
MFAESPQSIMYRLLLILLIDRQPKTSHIEL